MIDSEKSLASLDVDDISVLYDRLMNGFSSEMIETSSLLKEDGHFVELYAPGYDNNGVADVSAKCL